MSDSDTDRSVLIDRAPPRDRASPSETTVVPTQASYYFTNVTLQVAGILFRVPRDYFEQESEVFSDLFELPVASDAIADGSNDEHPLRLDGINREDFRQLLRVMFPTKLLVDEHFSVPQWTSVLKLSDLWQMDRLAGIVIEKLRNSNGSREDWIALLDLSDQRQLPQARNLAIQKLTSLLGHGIDKVLLARKYKVKDWLQSGLRELVQRDQFFSDEEEAQLGWQTTFKLCRIRDNENKQKHQPYHYYQSNIDGDIRREFQSELNGMPDENIRPLAGVYYG